jgi:hypothetical protein
MKKVSSYIFLAATALLMSSCQDYLNINEDPSNPQVAEGYALLPPIMAQMVRGEQFDGRYAGQYSQVWSSSAATIHGIYIAMHLGRMQGAKNGVHIIGL